MGEEKVKISSEEQLLQARESGLREASQVNAMCAHGKVLGMDTFSWVNPQQDVLATLLDSFPFSVLWVASHQQVSDCLQNYPQLTERIESIVVYESKPLNVKWRTLDKIKNVVCVEDVSSALEMVKSLKMPKSVFLFSTDGAEAKEQKEKFENFLSLYK